MAIQELKQENDNKKKEQKLVGSGRLRFSKYLSIDTKINETLFLQESLVQVTWKLNTQLTSGLT